MIADMMMKASKNKQSKKLVVALAVCFIILIAAELLFARSVNSDFSQLMQEQRKNSVSKMTQLANNSIKPILDELHTGAIDKDAARVKIVELVRNMTYEDEYGDNYIFMSTYDGSMLVQPFEPQKEGSDQWNLQDSYGKYIIRDLIQAAKEKPEGSFVSYHYYLPKEERIEEKLSYVIGIPEIGAYIGTGMYMESSYKDLQKALEFQRFGFILISVLILGFAAFYIGTLIRTNRYLSREIKEREYAESNIRTVFDSIHDAVMIHDQSGKMILANLSAAALYGIPEDQITKYSIQDFSYEEYDVEDKLSQSEFLENDSLLFEWKGKCPLDGTVFDAEVALRKSKWSGEEVIVAVVRDISERRKHEEEIRHLAYYDYLTSLHNRVFIMNELKQELEKCKVRENTGSILFIDLDDFKKVNDNFGHFFGDEVLKILADQLRKIKTKRFLPARIGGDEFVVLCYGADLTETMRTADQVLTVFRNPITLHDHIINFSCSMGIALYPKDGITVEDI
ncbi:MAG: cache domain-containing protein, partial [Eubacteriales bacterium]|nr:cache domain-containing protein [Eubacteriales bacterium]